MADVFISYKREERPQVAQLADSLRALNLSVWFDASLSAGEAFSDEIDREARAAKSILVCWSPTARESRWVKAEAEIGFTQDKLAAAYVAGPDGFAAPVPFNTIHAEDLRAWLASPHDTHSGWRSLLRRIGRLCGREDVETWGGLDAQATAAQLRSWINVHSNSPLFVTVDEMLTAREAQDADRARLEQEARERRAREEAERRERERIERERLAKEEAQKAREDEERRERERMERDRLAKVEANRVERLDGERRQREEAERQARQRATATGRWTLRFVLFAIAGIILVIGYNAFVTRQHTSTADVQEADASSTVAREPLAGSSSADKLLYAGQSVLVPYHGGQLAIALTGTTLHVTLGSGATEEHVLDFGDISPDLVSCRLIPSTDRFVVICSDTDYGAMFLGFLQPGSAGRIDNAINPLGRGHPFFLAKPCAPNVRPEGQASSPPGECYFSVPNTGFLILSAFLSSGGYGSEGSDVLAVDMNRARVIWPTRSSDIPGVGALRTKPSIVNCSFDRSLRCVDMNNVYTSTSISGLQFVAYAQPRTFSTEPSGAGLAIGGTVKFSCEIYHATSDQCSALPEARRSFESPVTWYFDIRE